MESLLNLHPQPGNLLVATTSILAALGGIALLLLLMMVRRAFRNYHHKKYDSLSFKMHQQWRDIVRGDIPPQKWRGNMLKCEIVLSIVNQEISAGVDKDRAGLQDFLRSSGLVDFGIRKVHERSGWARRRAMLALGSMRVPEAIAPLSEALDDWQLDTRMAAVQSLGRTNLAEAAAPIIEMYMVGGLKVPTDVVINSLIFCFKDCPEALLPYLRRSQRESRELLARVAGEIATPAMADDMIAMAADPNPEVRASAAKALAVAPLPLAIPALGDLARDEVWFIRLRATTAISQIPHPRTIPILLEAVRDSNRLVRIRAAAGLAKFQHETVDILRSIVDSHDLYALHSMITALELGGGFEKVLAELADPILHDEAASRLLSSLREGAASLWSSRPADRVVESVFP
jgi:HEAT repeat protein